MVLTIDLGEFDNDGNFRVIRDFRGEPCFTSIIETQTVDLSAPRQGF